MCLCSLYVCATRESCLGCGTYRTNPSVPFEEKIFDKDSPLCPGEPLLLLPLVPAEHRPLGHVPKRLWWTSSPSSSMIGPLGHVPTLTYHQSLQSLPLSLSSWDRTTDWIQTEHFQYHTSVNWKCSTLPSAPVVQLLSRRRRRVVPVLDSVQLSTVAEGGFYPSSSSVPRPLMSCRPQAANWGRGHCPTIQASSGH